MPPVWPPRRVEGSNFNGIKAFCDLVRMKMAMKTRSIGLFYLFKLRGPEAKTRILEAFSSEFLKTDIHHRNIRFTAEGGRQYVEVQADLQALFEPPVGV